MNAPSHLPTAREASLAQAALRLFGAHETVAGETTVEFRPEGASKAITITIPQEAFKRFLEVLAQMANGNAVTIVPIHAEFTTQQAAEYLNVSRPFLISLLEEKKLPYRMVGSHRRVRFADLQAFREADDKKREDVLAELAEDAQLNGHGY
jgi:excisionase family DNA binding protein